MVKRRKKLIVMLVIVKQDRGKRNKSGNLHQDTAQKGNSKYIRDKKRSGSRGSKGNKRIIK